ncbi:hypothetical protein [Helicobacter felis]|uniref:hypothetical protein n=1 Tax=Helicobacter felis TaxID=214 RepID=UPI001F2B002B|nr:hypothetical protein [Helicobacter felis]
MEILGLRSLVSMKQKPDLLVLVKNHDTLLIDESALVEGVFWKIYNDILKEVLQKTQRKSVFLKMS